MPVSSTANKVSYNGSTSALTVSFYFLESSDLKVIGTTASGAATETTLTLNTDYTVSGAGSTAGGSVTLSTGSTYSASTANVVTIRRVEQFLQPDDLPGAGDLNTQTIENMADRLTFLAQQLEEDTARSGKFRQTSAYSNLIFPDPSSGYLLGWSTQTSTSGNNVLSNLSASTSIIATLTTFSETLLAQTNAANWRSNLGVPSTSEIIANSTAVTAARQVPVYGSTAGTQLLASGVQISTNDALTGHYGGVVTRSTAFTLSSSEAGRFILSNPTTSITITIPGSTSTTLNAGYQLMLQNLSTQAITFSMQSTEDSLQSPGSQTILSTQYGMVSLVKTVAGSSTGNWGLDGRLSTA